VQLKFLLHFSTDIHVNNVEYMLQDAALLIFSSDKRVVLSKFSESNVRKSKKRIKRSLSGTKSDDNEKSKFEEDVSLDKSRQKHRKTSHLTSSQHRHRQHNFGNICRRADLYVDFKQLNWQDWILAPCLL
jgi:hypothetical protein